MGVNVQEYTKRVIDMKAEVDEKLQAIPVSELNNEIKPAEKGYIDAKISSSVALATAEGDVSFFVLKSRMKESWKALDLHLQTAIELSKTKILSASVFIYKMSLLEEFG